MRCRTARLEAVLRSSILRPTAAPGKAEHARPALVVERDAVMTIDRSQGRDAGGSRTHLNRVAAGRLAVWLQRQESECPRQELNLVHDLRRVVCESVTLRGHDQNVSRGQGFEPCPRVLEARCSPRSTPLFVLRSPMALAHAMASAGSWARNLAQLSIRAPCAA